MKKVKSALALSDCVRVPQRSWWKKLSSHLNDQLANIEIITGTRNTVNTNESHTLEKHNNGNFNSTPKTNLNPIFENFLPVCLSLLKLTVIHFDLSL